MLRLLEELLELLAKEQIEFEVKIHENINSLLKYMNEHFSIKVDRKSALPLENYSKNLVKLSQLEIVKFRGKPIACSRIWLSRVMIDSSLRLTITEKLNH